MQKKLLFEPISLPMKSKVESIRREFGNNLYVYNFASLYSWQKDEQYEICFFKDAFLIKNGAEGENAFLFPCGSESGKKELIEALLEYDSLDLYCLTDEDKEFLEKEFPLRFEFAERRSEFIYLFDKESQIALEGKEYKKQRHQINIGKASAEEWKTEPICEANIERAIEINRKWAQGKGGSGLLDADAAECALEHFFELSMFGIIFQADGEDAAFVAGSFITPEIFDLAFCKVLGDRRDFFIRWEFFRALPQEVKTIDSEEDLGIEGLRINKLSRHPEKLRHIWKGSLSL
ncbi:MAG: DUF2156 domain-containing protein [Eubacterium sp.]|nr:DUF2156 domain-containing protein [Eubacterium sp.]